MRDQVEVGIEAHSGGESRLSWRRWTMALLCVGTMASGLAAMGWLLSLDGLNALEIAILVLFGLTLPWTVIGFWNAVIGFAVLRFAKDPVAAVCPLKGLVDDERPVRARTAIVMPVFNEDTEMVFSHLRRVQHSLDSGPGGEIFDYFLLSDSNRPEVIQAEERGFDDWRAEDVRPERLHYRRREDNSGFKTGNLRDFCARWGDDYDYMIVLDADSLMTGASILRILRLMERNPELGILQTLAVGLPGESLFTRLFQFGMRHGMRSFTMGSAWWQGDCGPYWGHNAAIRLAPFIEHCKLPSIPGRSPLAGDILSHDQVEAALMRRAGYHVRVLPIEGGSFEINPPTLPDFIKRDLRWCQGNLQYLFLLGLRGLKPLSRIQLLLAIMMYVSGPAWFGFVGLGLLNAMTSGWNPVALAGLNMALILFIVFFGFSLAPRLMGFLDTLLDNRHSRAFGGRLAVLRGSLAEFVFGLFMGPIAAVSQTIFIAGLFFGKTIRWNAQARQGHEVSWRQAARGLWLHTILGTAALIFLWVYLPGIFPWGLPLFGALALSAPFAVGTAHDGISRRAVGYGLCATPEERVARLMPPSQHRLREGAYAGILRD